MTVIGYDAVNWRDIPNDAAMVLGYLDGSWPWPPEAWQHFAGAIAARIVVNPHHDAGDVYDCEPGNGHPSDAGPWARMRNAAGVAHPCIYCDRSDWSAVQHSVGAAGASGVVYWIADPPAPGIQGRPHRITGAVGVQYAFSTNLPPELHGRNVDISCFEDVAWLTHQEAPDMFDQAARDELNAVGERWKATDAAKDPAGTAMNDHWAIGWTWAYVQGIEQRMTAIEQTLARIAAKAGV